MTLIYSNSGDLSDFKAVLQDRRRSLNEFELSDSPQFTQPGIRSSLVGEVRVKCRKSGIERAYRSSSTITFPSAGAGYVQWVLDFLHDLDNGVFN